MASLLNPDADISAAAEDADDEDAGVDAEDKEREEEKETTVEDSNPNGDCHYVTQSFANTPLKYSARIKFRKRKY